MEDGVCNAYSLRSQSYIASTISKAMNSYHVFVSAKPHVLSNQLEERMEEFLNTQIADNHMVGYRIIRFNNTANFKEMPDYQIICDYDNEEKLNEGFAGMRPDRWKQEPHASMMEMVTDFRVSFSQDVAKYKSRGDQGASNNSGRCAPSA